MVTANDYMNVALVKANNYKEIRIPMKDLLGYPDVIIVHQREDLDTMEWVFTFENISEVK